MGANRKRPDLVIEVVVSSGGINKLEAYKRLQIPEVWFWINDELLFYSLGNEGYEAVSKSQLLPSLDVDLLMGCINYASSSFNLYTRKWRKMGCKKNV